MSDPTKLRALAWVARWYEAQHPGARTFHLAAWAEAEAEDVERIRRELGEWPAPDVRSASPGCRA